MMDDTADESLSGPRTPEAHPGSSIARAAPLLYRASVALFVFLLGASIIRALAGRHALDDAYMFVRYADHVIHDRCVCWNVPGSATYGLTGPAFLAIVIPFRLLLPSSVAATIIASSVSSGVLFLVLLYVLLARYSGASRRFRPAVTLFVLGSLVVGSKSLSFHFTSGMDTMFVLASMTALVIAHKHVEESPSRLSIALLGLATGLIVYVRPDLMIYGAGIPSTVLLIAPDAAARRRSLAILGIGAAVLALALECNRAYFGVPLPLPFYVKGLHSYTGAILRVYRYTSYQQLGIFLGRQWPLLLVTVTSVPYLLRRRGLRAFFPVELGLAASTLVFVTYYLFFVLQIMPHESRFYYPTIPPLMFLATRSLVLVFDTDGGPSWPSRVWEAMGGLARRHSRVAAGLAVVALVTVTCVTGYRAVQVVDSLRKLRAAHFDASALYAATMTEYWYRLDEVSRLPDDLVIGTTEVGMPSALNPKKTIIDLAGLNDTDLVRHGFHLDALVAHTRPDFLYLPHPDYADLNEALAGDPAFVAQYETFPAEKLRSSMGIAIRRDGPHFAALEAIALEGPRDPAQVAARPTDRTE
jgi:hypothetical protein